ncbi:MAG: thioesterase family protein, partial [Rhodococcus fascians]
MTNSKPGYHATITVRWSDMDAFAHINHARMVTLLEEARIEWLLSTGDAPGERPEDR